jgi:hypothetical protein
VGATLLMVNHFGVHHWPTAPSPATVTRLITPTEAVSRVGERVISRRGDDPVPVAARSDRAPDAALAEHRPAARPATRPVGRAPRVRHHRNDSPAPAPATQPVATHQPQQPQVTVASTPPPATQQPGPVPSEQDHARVDDVVVPTPVVTPPPAPPLAGPQTPVAPAPEPRPSAGGLVRDLLNAVGVNP